MGAVTGPAPDGVGRGLRRDRRRALRRAGCASSAFMVEGESVSLRSALDQRHRAWGPANLLGLDTKTLGGVAEGSFIVRGKPAVPRSAVSSPLLACLAP